MRSPASSCRIGTVARVLLGGAALAAFALGGRALPSAEAQNAPGALYTETNQPSGNQIAVFARAADGTLTSAGTIATGGLGSASGLGSQGAVALSDDHRYLFAVNAGSNDISSFSVVPGGLVLVSGSPFGAHGVSPISVTVHGNLLYVVNAGDATHPANIHGFTIQNGRLQSVPSSDRPLSAANPGPAEIAFRPDGRVLVVTEKNTNDIDTYVVDNDGRAGPPSVSTFAPSTPFGFAFTGKRLAIVSDAGSNAVSSYAIKHDGSVKVKTALAGDGNQTAPCWVAITHDGRFAYSANAHTDTLSGFTIDGGTVRLLAQRGVTVSGQGPTDLAISSDDTTLYAITNGSQSISVFRIHRDGSLSPLSGPTGLSGGLTGLAVR